MPSWRMRPSCKSIDPAVDGQLLVSFPGGLDDGRGGGVEDLVDDVEFAETIDSRLFLRNAGEMIAVLVDHILDVAQPVVDQAELFVPSAARTPPQP